MRKVRDIDKIGYERCLNFVLFIEEHQHAPINFADVYLIWVGQINFDYYVSLFVFFYYRYSALLWFDGWYIHLSMTQNF